LTARQASQPAPLSEKWRRLNAEGGPRPRRRGPKAATRRANRLRDGRSLTPERELLLRATCRLSCHLDNVSDALFRQGELTPEGEPLEALSSTIGALFDRVRGGLSDVFGDGASDLFGPSPGGSR
jgi:hypothetical protein